MEKLLELYEARLRNICGKLGGIVRVESKQAQQYFYDLCIRKECFQLIIEDIKSLNTKLIEDRKTAEEAAKCSSLSEFNNGNQLSSEFDFGFIKGVEFAQRELSKEAIAFCVWTHRQYWCISETGLWFNPLGILKGDETEYTTEQLFEMFKKDEKL
jgi:hypothetical protein